MSKSTWLKGILVHSTYRRNSLLLKLLLCRVKIIQTNCIIFLNSCQVKLRQTNWNGSNSFLNLLGVERIYYLVVINQSFHLLLHCSPLLLYPLSFILVEIRAWTEFLMDLHILLIVSPYQYLHAYFTKLATIIILLLLFFRSPLSLLFSQKEQSRHTWI